MNLEPVVVHVAPDTLQELVDLAAANDWTVEQTVHFAVTEFLERGKGTTDPTL